MFGFTLWLNTYPLKEVYSVYILTYSISSGTTAQENRTHPPCELLPPKKSHLTLEGFVFCAFSKSDN